VPRNFVDFLVKHVDGDGFPLANPPPPQTLYPRARNARHRVQQKVSKIRSGIRGKLPTEARGPLEDLLQFNKFAGVVELKAQLLCVEETSSSSSCSL
jgi:hypothetical protein